MEKYHKPIDKIDKEKDSELFLKIYREHYPKRKKITEDVSGYFLRELESKPAVGETGTGEMRSETVKNLRIIVK